MRGELRLLRKTEETFWRDEGSQNMSWRHGMSMVDQSVTYSTVPVKMIVHREK